MFPLPSDNVSGARSNRKHEKERERERESENERYTTSKNVNGKIDARLSVSGSN